MLINCLGPKELIEGLAVPEESEPPSGLPLEYIVANLPSSMNLNQPLLPLDNSRAQDSFQR